jgi:hypothetical protein
LRRQLRLFPLKVRLRFALGMTTLSGVNC